MPPTVAVLRAVNQWRISGATCPAPENYSFWPPQPNVTCCPPAPPPKRDHRDCHIPWLHIHTYLQSWSRFSVTSLEFTTRNYRVERYCLFLGVAKGILQAPQSRAPTSIITKPSIILWQIDDKTERWNQETIDTCNTWSLFKWRRIKSGLVVFDR